MALFLHPESETKKIIMQIPDFRDLFSWLVNKYLRVNSTSIIERLSKRVVFLLSG